MKIPKILVDIRNATATSIWPVLVFALIALGAGLGAMAALASDVTAGAITTLVTAVLITST